MPKTGYRCGPIGAFTGEGSSIAWKALDFEYRELGNDHVLDEVAEFLKVPKTTWPKVRAEFRKRYGDARGIWLSRTRKDAKQYEEYGPPELVPYEEADVISDLHGDGIYVFDRREQDSPEPRMFEFEPVEDYVSNTCDSCREIIHAGQTGIQPGGIHAPKYHKSCYSKLPKKRRHAEFAAAMKSLG